MLLNKKPLLRRIREYPEPEGTQEDQKSHIQYIIIFFFVLLSPKLHIVLGREGKEKSFG